MDSKGFGKRGEDSASSFLCGKGFTVIGRNVRMNHLETDIIAKNDTHIVFCEVKTRSEYPGVQHRYGRPAAAVDLLKQKKLIAAAEEYLRRNRAETQGLQPRIDVIEVYVQPGSEKYKVLKIVHMENAVRRS
ncbi:MAG: YraN family protein [Ruminococcaceae bacterium]|nr:YraN family protein [Oscillospiraceae bacterium]